METGASHLKFILLRSNKEKGTESKHDQTLSTKQSVI